MSFLQILIPDLFLKAHAASFSPAIDQLVVKFEGVEDAGDDKVYTVFKGLGVLVKSRRGREDDGSRPRQLEQVLEVD